MNIVLMAQTMLYSSKRFVYYLFTCLLSGLIFLCFFSFLSNDIVAALQKSVPKMLIYGFVPILSFTLSLSIFDSMQFRKGIIFKTYTFQTLLVWLFQIWLIAIFCSINYVYNNI